MMRIQSTRAAVVLAVSLVIGACLVHWAVLGISGKIALSKRRSEAIKIIASLERSRMENGHYPDHLVVSEAWMADWSVESQETSVVMRCSLGDLASGTYVVMYGSGSFPCGEFFETRDSYDPID